MQHLADDRAAFMDRVIMQHLADSEELPWSTRQERSDEKERRKMGLLLSAIDAAETFGATIAGEEESVRLAKLLQQALTDKADDGKAARLQQMLDENVAKNAKKGSSSGC